MFWSVLYPFLAVWSGLLSVLMIHVGYINCRWRIHEWPVAMFYVAVLDKRTRNDFWHIVSNAGILAACVVFILVALGKLHV